MRWEMRYSSSEMGFLEVLEKEVVFYLNDRRNTDERWTFDEVMRGKADYLVNSLYGNDVLIELMFELKERMGLGEA